MNRGRAVAPGRAMWGLAVAVVALLAIACSAGSTVDERAIPVTTSRAAGARARANAHATTTTTSLTTTTTTTLPVVPGVDPTLEKTVWDAYVAALDSMDYAAADPPNRSSAIDAHLTNAMLTTWQDQLAQYVKDGESAHLPLGTTRRSLLYGANVRNPNWVDLDTCLYDDAIVSVTATGAVVDGTTTYLRSTATMWLEDGTWRLAGIDGTDGERSQCPGF